jgi:putative SOS response-associated peptidase YedK
VRDRFRLDGLEPFAPRDNIAPSTPVLAVREAEGRRLGGLLRWGLVPHWAKEEKIGYSMINARAETVSSKPAFRDAFRRRRCLMPASGFYEWRQGPGGKQPYYIRGRDEDLMAFAGVWERWTSPEGRKIETCAIIVTEANELVRPIHDRMPVILGEDTWRSWLDGGTPTEALRAMLTPCPSAWLTAYPGSADVNSPRNDSEALLAEVAGG